MAGTSAGDILAEVDPDSIPAESPPPGANYREADIAGIACQFCSKFQFKTFGEGDVAEGYCAQWEANVKGDHVSDAFSDPSPALDGDGNPVWDADFASDERVVHELHFGGEAPEKVSEKRFRKAILRTGKWLFTPTASGPKKRPLSIVRDGTSDPEKGVIALSELVENFQAKALPYVPLTLSDGEREHPTDKAKLTQWGKGFVRNLFIQDEADGTSKLMADIDVTEPEVAEKLERQTIADCSSGIPFGIVRKTDGKIFNAVLEHVALTNNPYVDDLGPFAIAASDDHPVEVENYSEAPDDAEDDNDIIDPALGKQLSFRQIQTGAQDALVQQLALSSDYRVEDVTSDSLTITNEIAKTTWTVPYKIEEDEKIVLSAIDGWETVEDEGKVEPSRVSATPRQLTELEKAQRLRELRSPQNGNDTTGGVQMTGSTIPGVEALEGVELSDEARASIQSVLDENARLKARTRESECDTRLGELKELGFENRPGFLKLYRQVFLSDDGGPRHPRSRYRRDQGQRGQGRVQRPAHFERQRRSASG
jgi:hypothetical protein